jgi:hypothetical protein
MGKLIGTGLFDLHGVVELKALMEMNELTQDDVASARQS